MVALLFAWLGSSFALASSATVIDHVYDNASDGSPVISFIQSANKTLDVEIYTMKDTNVIAALKDAMGRGVKLRIIQTPTPVLDACPVFKPSDVSTPADCLALRQFVTYVNAHHGVYIPFSFALCGDPTTSCYQHGKMMIADKKHVLLSTGNFDPTNLCDLPEAPARCNRDYTMLTTDSKVAKTLSTIFQNDIAGTAYDLETVLAISPRVTASPDSMQPLVDFINSATKTLQIQNQYLNDPTMNDAIMAAASRGVKVSVMVSSVTAFGKLNPTSDQTKIGKWTTNFKAFDQAGVVSRIFDDAMKVNGKPGYLHAKAMVVDGLHAWIGSVNGSTKSLTMNREFGIFSDDKAVVAHLSSVMSADFNNRKAETWKQSLVCKNDACASSLNSGPDGGGDTNTAYLNDESSEVVTSELSDAL